MLILVLQFGTKLIINYNFDNITKQFLSIIFIQEFKKLPLDRDRFSVKTIEKQSGEQRSVKQRLWDIYLISKYDISQLMIIWLYSMKSIHIQT